MHTHDTPVHIASMKRRFALKTFACAKSNAVNKIQIISHEPLASSPSVHTPKAAAARCGWTCPTISAAMSALRHALHVSHGGDTSSGSGGGGASDGIAQRIVTIRVLRTHSPSARPRRDGDDVAWSTTLLDVVWPVYSATGPTPGSTKSSLAPLGHAAAAAAAAARTCKDGWVAKDFLALKRVIDALGHDNARVPFRYVAHGVLCDV